MTMTSPCPPRVSIGLPVYNGERYVAETIEAIRTQTFSDFELIISDNASTDRTEGICRSVASLDKRIRYVRNEHNIGAVGNYRAVQELAKGEYFRWANYDDLIAPQMVARCVEVLDREPSVVLAYTKCRLIDGDGKFLSFYEDGLDLRFPRPSDRFIWFLQHFGLGNAQYGLMRASTLEQVKIRASHVAWDNVFLSELSLYGRFWEIPDVLFSRRIHDGAFSRMTSAEQLSVYYGGTARPKVSMRTWRIYLGYLLAALRTSMPLSDKTRILAFLARWGIWERKELARELVQGARTVFPELRRDGV